MKKIIISFALFLPALAGATSVQVYPEATYTHGAQIFPKDMSSEIVVNGLKQLGTGVERFYVSPGAYQVTYVTPPGYAAVMGNGCVGTLAADEDVTCYVSITDGVPIVVTPPPPAAAPAPVVEPIVVPQITVPEPVYAPIYTPAEAPASAPATTTTSNDSFSTSTATTSPSVILEATTTSATTTSMVILSLQDQIARLQEQVIALYKLIILILTQNIAGIK